MARKGYEEMSRSQLLKPTGVYGALFDSLSRSR
jgi:hypothetical protein